MRWSSLALPFCSSPITWCTVCSTAAMRSFTSASRALASVSCCPTAFSLFAASSLDLLTTSNVCDVAQGSGGDQSNQGEYASR